MPTVCSALHATVTSRTGRCVLFVTRGFLCVSLYFVIGKSVQLCETEGTECKLLNSRFLID